MEEASYHFGDGAAALQLLLPLLPPHPLYSTRVLCKNYIFKQSFELIGKIWKKKKRYPIAARGCCKAGPGWVTMTAEAELKLLSSCCCCGAIAFSLSFT
ncbi:hypothetical protein CRG98_047128 [Punica granatum]|uniref:Uncharacterized protein n=1 Tax=Punica granatum TaxID=22663 RepID=A0A2I0HME7_PUNGR|nr:hypothetical protein CRG98_047128 [Punica granatum]